MIRKIQSTLAKGRAEGEASGLKKGLVRNNIVSIRTGTFQIVVFPLVCTFQRNGSLGRKIRTSSHTQHPVKDASLTGCKRVASSNFLPSRNS